MAASLDDMMMALHRADAAGNSGDAGQIARMIQSAYPDHVQAALNMTPMAPPTMGGGVVAPIATGLVRASAMSPISAPVSQGVDINAMQQQIRANGAGLAQPPGPQAAPGGGGSGPEGPPAAGGASEGLGSDIANFGMSALRSWVGNIPGGNYLAAGLGSAMSPIPNMLQGKGAMPTPPSEVLAQIQNAQQQAAQASPGGAMLGNAIGTGVSLAAAGGALTAGAKLAAGAGLPLVSQLGRGVAAVADTLGAPAKSTLGGAAKLAATGAIGGVGQAVNETLTGQNSLADLPAHAAVDAAIGAVAGPVVGKAVSSGWDYLATKAAKLFGSGAMAGVAGQDAATDALVRTIKPTGAELEAMSNKIATANGGQTPPLATVLPAFAQAQVRAAAGKTPVLGNILMAAKQQQEADAQTIVPSLLSDVGANTPTNGLSPTGSAGVQKLGDVQLAVTQNMDKTMQGGSLPLSQQRVSLFPGDENVLMHPNVQSTLRTAPQATQDAYGNVIDTLQNGNRASLPLGLLDKIRRGVSAHYSADNPLGNDSMNEALNGLRGITDRSPPYAAALDTYAKHAAFAQGFQAGQGGKAIADIPGATAFASHPVTGEAYTMGHGSGLLSGLSQDAATSPSGAASVLRQIVDNPALGESLAKVHGQSAVDDLSQRAKALDANMQAVNAIAPTRPVGDPAGHINDNAAAHGVAAAATGNVHAATSNFIRIALDAVGLGKNKISEAQAAGMADMLLRGNPQRVIDAMRKQGAHEEDLARLRAYVSAASGASATQALGQ